MSSLKKLEKETQVKVNQDKGVITDFTKTCIWVVGDLKKDDVLKNEFRLEQLKKPPSDLKSLCRMSLCLKFEIVGFNFSTFKLLKVEFTNGHKEWKKFGSELAKSGLVEIQLC